MNDFSNEKLLVIAPHSDDEILGCGGLISKVKKEGGKVYVLIFNLGFEKDDTKESQEKRKNEVQEAMNVLKEANWYNSLRLKFLYNHLTSHVGSKKAYAPEDRLGYQAIIDGKEINERYTPEQIATINNLVHRKQPDASF